MGKRKPKDGQPAGEAGGKPKGKTGFMRAPHDIAEMLDTISQHELNGWKSVAAVLDSDDCPLRDWLLPLYERVVREKAKLAEEFKRRAGTPPNPPRPG